MRRPDDLYKWGVWIAVFYAFWSPVLQDIKLLQITPWVQAALFYVSLPLITLCFVLSLVLRKDVSIWRVDAVEAVLGFALVWSWIWVPFYGGDIGDIGGNFIRVVFAVSAYKASRLYAFDPWMRGIAPRLSKWGLWGVVWALVGLYVLGVFGPFYVYLSLNSEEIFVALATALTLASSRRIPYSTGIFVLVMMGGRRGAILAAFAMILLKYAMNWNAGLRAGTADRAARVRAHWRRATLLGIGVVCIGGAFGAIQWARANPKALEALPDNVKLRVVPLILATESPDGPDTTTLTGKRNIEVIAVFRQWAEDPLEMLTGQGYGATWTNQDGERDSTVHFSPVAVSLIYGIPLAAAIYGVMLWLPGLALVRAVRGLGDREEQIWALVTFGLIALSLTGFSLFQNYVLWIGLGLLRAFTARTEQPAC